MEHKERKIAHLNRVLSVSYTHLDVYKRQSLERVSNALWSYSSMKGNIYVLLFLYVSANIEYGLMQLLALGLKTRLKPQQGNELQINV